MDNSDTESPEG